MYIEGIFYTSDYVVRGFVDSAQERLSDYLNIKSDATFVVYDANVGRMLNIGKTPAMGMPEARLDKQSILFAIPIEVEKVQSSFYRRANRIIHPVNVMLPFFSLVGSIHLTEKFDTRRVLLSRLEDFIPLTEVTATYLLNPNAPIRSNIVIFNKNRMVLIGEQLKDNEPANGTTSSG